MFILKLYITISFMIYFFMGLYLIKKRQMQPITLISLLIFSIFWLPFCVYVIFSDER